MGVALLEVAEAADELFAGDFFVVGEEVALGGLAGYVYDWRVLLVWVCLLLDQQHDIVSCVSGGTWKGPLTNVGVGCHASNCADHVVIQYV